MAPSVQYFPLEEHHFDDVVALADEEIGLHYYNKQDLQSLRNRSVYEGKNLSFVAYQDKKCVGFRFTCSPGNWEHGRGIGLSPQKWKFPLSETAYFQSCFVASSVMGQGVGRQLSHAALDALRQTNVPQVVAHSWKESPHQSSFRYLSKLGFTTVVEYPRYWEQVDYICPRCGHPCLCTAIEMVLELK